MKDQVTSVERPLRLVNGKFMRGDVEEKPEIGNSEQIALLRKFEQEAEKVEKAAKAGKLDVEIYTEDIEYKVVCEFTCICGNKIKERDTNYTDDWEELEARIMRVERSPAINAVASMKLMAYMQS